MFRKALVYSSDCDILIYKELNEEKKKTPSLQSHDKASSISIMFRGTLLYFCDSVRIVKKTVQQNEQMNQIMGNKYLFTDIIELFIASVRVIVGHIID